MSKIDEKLLDHLLDLARLDASEKEKPKLLKDLGAILKYVEQLNGVNTEKVQPMTGGTPLETVLRKDEIDPELKKREAGETGRVIESFPEKQDGYLKAPHVF